MGVQDADVPERPPDDPEEWTDEQWLDWLVATDDASEPGTASDGQLRKITQSAPGFVLGQAMLGLAQAIYGRKDNEVVIVAEGDGEPGGDQPFTVHLDPDHPDQSYVTFQRESDRTN